MSTMRFTVEVDFDLTLDKAAEWFCNLDSHAQAAFFLHVAKRAKTWGDFSPDMQWCYIGQHLADLHPDWDGAREMVRAIAGHMETYITENLNK